MLHHGNLKIPRGRPVRVTLDPGHGGPDLGGIAGIPSVTEKDVNLSVALQLRDMLWRQGWEVALTRERDESVELSRRVEVAREFGADVFVSIHHNATAWGDRELNRSEAYYQVGREGTGVERLANLVVEELDAALRLGRLVLPAYSYHVLRENSLCAVIGEASHISHPDEARRLMMAERIAAEAEAYRRALLRWARGEGACAPWYDEDWEKAAAVNGTPRVLLDPDGGYPAAREPDGYADATVAVVGVLAARLAAHGWAARSTRRAGECVSLADRVRRAHRFKADATVTVSFDVQPCPLARTPGSSRAYARWESSQRLSRCMAEACTKIALSPVAEALPGSDWLAMHGAPTFACCRASPLSWFEYTQMNTGHQAVAAALEAGLVAYFSQNT